MKDIFTKEINDHHDQTSCDHKTSSESHLVPILVDCAQSRLADGTCPRLLVQSVSWCLLDRESHRVLSRRSELVDCHSNQYKASLESCVGKLIAELGDKEGAVLVTCGPHSLRQYLLPAGKQNSVQALEESELFAKYIDLNKEFANRFGYLLPQAQPQSQSHSQSQVQHQSGPEEAVELASFRAGGAELLCSALADHQQFCFCCPPHQFYYQHSPDQLEASGNSNNLYPQGQQSQQQQQPQPQQPEAESSSQTRQLEEMLKCKFAQRLGLS